MRVHTLVREQVLPGAPEEIFEFFAEPLNLEAITPPLLRFRVVTPQPIEMRAGTILQYRLRLRGLALDWLTRIAEWAPGERFVDEQLVGPYRLWHHTHEFEPCDGGTLMRDTVRYALPLWPLGELAAPIVRRELRRIFDYRREQCAARLSRPSLH
ncbi:MAG TPA: SRPBCC family protein [Thermoleophilaceae bacterium]|nr:SRPBCC family protein [Thermoleophilaceae bacterium]